MTSPEKENQNSRSLHSYFDVLNKQSASRLSEPSQSDHESPLKFGEANRVGIPKPSNAQKEKKKCSRKITDYMGFKTSPPKHPAPAGLLSGSDNSLSGAGDFRFSDSDVLDIRTPRKIKKAKHKVMANKDTQTTQTTSLVDKDEMARRIAEENEAMEQKLERLKNQQVGLENTVKELLIEECKQAREAARITTHANTERLGKYKWMRQGGEFTHEFVDGKAFAELALREKALEQEKEKNMAAVNALKKMRKANKKDRDGFARPHAPNELSEQELQIQEESLQIGRDHHRAKVHELQQQRARLEIERKLHMKELSRQEQEDSSKFNDYQLLNNRYLPLQLAGKGGFSEVWKAYDLKDNIVVACKIHYVNPNWSEALTRKYIRNVIRERDIQKKIDHKRIVKLYDRFYIEKESYCTVLEYCEGDDLETYLKEHTLNEQQARSVIQQVVTALYYLNTECNPAVIHYDLKPANILLVKENQLEVKITDFGLSKLMDDDSVVDSQGGIELTSLGAGTLWYLPPECFPQGPGPSPIICPKVDVWSVGVIFYQLLYGVKPFGNNETQKSVWKNRTIANATQVSFPPKPVVSPQAQNFIRRCLQYDRESRADAKELYNHELFTKKLKDSSTSEA